MICHHDAVRISKPGYSLGDLILELFSSSVRVIIGLDQQYNDTYSITQCDVI